MESNESSLTTTSEHKDCCVVKFVSVGSGQFSMKTFRQKTVRFMHGDDIDLSL